MQIKYRQGDLFQSPHTVLVHGCNAQGVMGSGVARIVRDQFPEAYAEYRTVYESATDKGLSCLPLGSIVPVATQGRVIVNAITQKNFGGDGARYVSYDAVADSMAATEQWCLNHGYEEFAMPRIGAGLGGGDWRVIAQIIECTVNHAQVWVYDL